ncbi:MAG: hypothetical protein J7L26_00825, partial [Candidatus Aminicenantes bacterium]|nr:hypothetical protein [Candidatus Aminicenantes bacterium]
MIAIRPSSLKSSFVPLSKRGNKSLSPRRQDLHLLSRILHHLHFIPTSFLSSIAKKKRLPEAPLRKLQTASLVKSAVFQLAVSSSFFNT